MTLSKTVQPAANMIVSLPGSFSSSVAVPAAVNRSIRLAAKFAGVTLPVTALCSC
jgi:hypothetical protein